MYLQRISLSISVFVGAIGRWERGRRGEGANGELPVFHVGLLGFRERVEDVLFFALGKFRHEVDEGRHEDEASETIRIGILSGQG